MNAWLAGAWSQLWPNLAANVVWAPLVWVHHRVLTRHVRALRQHVTALHAQHEALIVRHVLGGAVAVEEKGAVP